ncbi:nutrient deprivation-induced protein [Sinorhizobium meliloti]|uniref:nutrient deprivation-induced protein n=1 Tax=Rhizobium meliloti TaxID=382 RepID=UPI00299EDE6E|nr:nutrient deprivation-induced protein [Sinorhizobium meliloti]MDW9616052.1 nutrient deprivation-induced protein [Sinorhizobium meliloti]
MTNDTSGRGSGDPLGRPLTAAQGIERVSGVQAGETGGQSEAGDRSLENAVREDVNEFKEFASEQTEQAKAAVGRAVEDEKNVAARQLSGVAAALEKVGNELEQSDQRAIGRYAKQIGTSLQGFARKAEGRNLGEIAGMVEDFGRKQPLAFLGMAAIAGLAASRFLTASPPRPDGRDASGRTRQSSEKERYNG